jgi:hypothetical protein
MKIFHLVFGVLLGKKGKRGKGEKEKREGRMLLFSSFLFPSFFFAYTRAAFVSACRFTITSVMSSAA